MEMATDTTKKRTAKKAFDIPYKVYKLDDPAKRICSYRLAKPANLVSLDGEYENVNDLPSVCGKKEKVVNNHSFLIMFTVRHANILCMKGLDIDKSDAAEQGSLIAFVEPVKGTLNSLFGSPQFYAGSSGIIPSPNFQKVVRELVCGMLFLWSNGLYHGNLKWDTTLYADKCTVKLANFEVQDSLSPEEARRSDHSSFVSMLQEISNLAVLENVKCDLFNSFISMASSLEGTPVVGLEAAFLDHTFFWGPAERKYFFASTVSLKLRDKQFVNKLPADLCVKPWNTSYDIGFCELVTIMNQYRVDETKKYNYGKNIHSSGKKDKPYNEYSVEDFVRCVCGLYSHENEIKVKDKYVDRVVHVNCPLLAATLKSLI